MESSLAGAARPKKPNPHHPIYEHPTTTPPWKCGEGVVVVGGGRGICVGLKGVQ